MTRPSAASIQVSGLSFRIPNYIQRERASKGWLREFMAEAFTRSKREYRTILSGLDFRLDEGDRVALLGRNGAGKTTLLRLLSGAFQPTEGMLQVTGSRQALLNLGLGFNPQATVRENIYLRATAMGLRFADISHLIESILQFSGLQDVAGHRLLTLSSGQRMRLGFAISTSYQHDIMLMDEWFGAGDAQFVDNARARLNDRVKGCKIMVLATHNFQMARQVCTKGMVIEDGKQIFLGPIEDAINSYKAIYQSTPEYARRLKARTDALRKEKKLLKAK